MAKLTKRTSPRARKAGPAPLLVVAPTAIAAPSQESHPIHLPRPGGFWSVFALVLSFFVPELGLALAFIYAPQEDRQARNFGRWCLALALIGALASAVTGAVRSALGSGEWLVQPYN